MHILRACHLNTTPGWVAQEFTYWGVCAYALADYAIAMAHCIGCWDATPTLAVSCNANQHGFMLFMVSLLSYGTIQLLRGVEYHEYHAASSPKALKIKPIYQHGFRLGSL